MKENIPELIVEYEKNEKAKLIKQRKKNYYNINKRGSYSFIYFLFLYNKNNIVEIITNNYDSLKGEIIEIENYPNNNYKLKGIVLINVTKNHKLDCIFKKLYIPLSNIRTCAPVVSSSNNLIKHKSISNVIISGYKNLMVNEIYEKFKKIGG
ncbi:conserved protein, unknown function [Hepatocystis sp. ex Piliocolobus tephrosceles]|nr:conserved protein, unknown function [Hepatocystis sp. ex Piliocolobus tephrosceles]